MESASTNCQHPFKRVRTEFSEENICFRWCRDCKKVIEWYAAHKRIPMEWPPRVRRLAHELTGYKSEQDPKSRIVLPITAGTDEKASATLAEMLNKFYSQDFDKWEKRIIGKLFEDKFEVNQKKALLKKLYGGK